MLDEADLRLMSPEQRARIAQILAAIDPPPPFDSRARRRRTIALTISVVCCLVLAAWIGVLATTLPAAYRAGGWRGAWVGFDVALLASFASVAWTAWRGKQLLIVCLLITATLLCCDAWFDLALDWGTSEFGFSILTAVVAELPLAGLMILGARRLLRQTIAVAMARQGAAGPVPPLWRVALFGREQDSPGGSAPGSVLARVLDGGDASLLLDDRKPAPRSEPALREEAGQHG